MDIFIKSLGTVAMIISLSSNIPQVYKMYKTKKTNDVSNRSLYLSLTGLSLMEVYSSYLGLWEIFGPNVLAITLISAQVILKRLYDNNDIRLLEEDIENN